MKELKIFFDLDGTILDFYGAFNARYKNLDWENQVDITNKVQSLRYNKKFWENLPLLERPNFEPTAYCTKRINPKKYTIENLKKYNLPEGPIYQVYDYSANKADYIKGICDVLIEDDISNVIACNAAGLPTLLIDRPHNRKYECKYRIYSLTYEEITTKYQEIWR